MLWPGKFSLLSTSEPHKSVSEDQYKELLERTIVVEETVARAVSELVEKREQWQVMMEIRSYGGSTSVSQIHLDYDDLPNYDDAHVAAPPPRQGPTAPPSRQGPTAPHRRQGPTAPRCQGPTASRHQR
jgi:hypothetical protein